MQLYRPNNPRQLKIASIGKASKEDKELVPFAIESAVGTSALTLTALLGALGLTGTSLFCESRICFSRNRSWRNYGCY
ncbi:UNVERIFIED_CONTAM: hypothetical protein Sradi_7312100 [Sesamum radiatum]|uniref:Uncharacterized protein n=1 Tax=Sesamum radiatum TaxID=300843 RepID=A0AAW2I821_SESRA